MFIQHLNELIFCGKVFFCSDAGQRDPLRDYNFRFENGSN